MSKPLDPPPRKAHLRRALRNARRGYRTMFALVILVFGGWAALDALRWYDLTYGVRTAEGKIVKKYTIPRHATKEGHLEYTFRTGAGERITADSAIDPAIFERASVDQPCIVVYFPDNPQAEHWLFNNDAIRMNVLYLALGHGLAALLAIVVLRVVERPLQRELRLARTGIVTQGQIVTIGKPRGRRKIVRITYSFVASNGATITGRCVLPRRFPAEALAPGTSIDVVVDPSDPHLHRPRLAFDRVEFGDIGKKKPAET